MCTCIDFKTKNHYFGRTLDLEYRFNEKVCITPRHYSLPLKNGKVLEMKYALIGMATVADNYPLYAEACNEVGLAMAGLNFPGLAHYFDPIEGKENVTCFEIINIILGTFKNVSEVKEYLKNVNITNIPFGPSYPTSPLHWMVSDDKECIVIEQQEDGLHIYDNPVGVMTNSPSFDFQLTNLNNYMNLTPYYAENKFSSKVNLKPYGQGMGSLGLPGDTSPCSRFVRAAFNKLNSICDYDVESSVSQFFHILDSVSMIKGTTITKQNKCDITSYSCCMDTTLGIYFYKTYGNSQITAITLNEESKSSKELTTFELVEKQQFNYVN